MLERWRVAETRAQELLRESAEVREAARELEEATADYERTAAHSDAEWERVQAARSMVYYLRRPGDGMIKIGTTRKLRARLAQHRIEYGPLQILLIRAGGFHEESVAHRKFDAYRIGRTEWFYPAHPVLAWISKARGHHVLAGIQPEDALARDELRRLVRAAPREADLQWENGILRWPPEGLAA